MFTKEQQEVIDNFPIFIPEPVRTNYFRNVFASKPDAIAFLKNDAVKSKNFIDKSFTWRYTPEGYDYWQKVNIVYKTDGVLDITKELINLRIPVESPPPKPNITYSVTEPLIVATKTCVYPLPGFTIMNDYLLNNQGEIRDDAGIWRNLSLHEQRSFIDSGETKIEKHKIPDIPIVRKFTEEEVQEFIRDFDKTTPDEVDYDRPTKIFSGKKRKSKFSPTNNIS